MKIHRTFIVLLIFLLTGCAVNRDFKNLPVHYAPIKQGQLEYYEFGNGTPIVLIAGYATDLSSWHQDFLSTLAAKHQVIIFNNRNVGRSFVRSSNYSTRDLAVDTYQLMQILHLKKPAILGISMGGMIAQQIASDYPTKIGPLILANTGIAGRAFVHPNALIENKMLNMPNNKLSRYWWALELCFPDTSRMAMSWSLIVNRFYPDSYEDITPVAVIPMQQHLVKQWLSDDTTAKKITRLRTPVLIINGGRDAVIPPVNSLILSNTLSHSQLYRWNDAGHAIIYQHPVEVATMINLFLQKNNLHSA